MEIRRNISATAFILLLSLAACDGPSGLVANNNADNGSISDIASNAVAPEPASTTTVANSNCAAFGPKDRIMTGVLKWGVPLDEAVQRLKCMDFVVGKPFGNTDLVAQRRPISHLKATLGRTTVRLTFTDVPGEERVIRVRQEASFEKSDAQDVDSIISRLVEQFGPFLSPPRPRADVHTGMIARDVNVAEAGGDAQWPKRCFDAGMSGVDSTQACGETIIYGITTFANSDYVRSYSLSINNYRETARAIAQAGGASAPGQAQNIAMSDGVMKREAQDIAASCSTNIYQKKFFNCQCLGNEFLKLICPLRSGPETMIVWTTKGSLNAIQEAQAGRDYRQAA